MDVIVDRCAGLDVHKKTVTACVRTPGPGRTRCSQVRTYQTFSDDLWALAEWLQTEGVTQVAMEATGVFWKPVWWVLEEAGFELLLVNPAHVKRVPGRKTDVKDSEWLAELLGHGLLASSFVPSPLFCHASETRTAYSPSAACGVLLNRPTATISCTPFCRS